MAERDPRQSECTVCVSAFGLNPIACAHFDGQVVCLWAPVDGLAVACGPSSEPHTGAIIGSNPSCGDAYKMFDTIPVARDDYDRRAELLRLGAVHA